MTKLLKLQKAERKQYQKLFELAQKLKALRPWHLLQNEELFAVYDPDSDTMLYCVIMGALGDVFGMSVYPGTQGLISYLGTLSQSIPKHELKYNIRALVISYEDRKDLRTQDYRLIKTLDLRFRGSKQWTQFTSYEPGYIDALPDFQERKHLELAQQGALKVIQEIRKNPEFLNTSEPNSIKMLSPKKKQAGWDIMNHNLQRPSTEDNPELPPLDRQHLQRLEKKITTQKGIWECAVLWVPIIIEEGEKKPYYPRLALLAEHRSGYILNQTFAAPSEALDILPNLCLETIENFTNKPEKFLVATNIGRKLLEPISKSLGIRLEQKKRLPMIEECFQELIASF